MVAVVIVCCCKTLFLCFFCIKSPVIYFTNHNICITLSEKGNSGVSQTNACGNNALVVERVDADTVAFQVKRKLTDFTVFQLVLVDVRPTPDPRVHHVRKPFPRCHLKHGISSKQLSIFLQIKSNQIRRFAKAPNLMTSNRVKNEHTK